MTCMDRFSSRGGDDIRGGMPDDCSLPSCRNNAGYYASAANSLVVPACYRHDGWYETSDCEGHSDWWAPGSIEAQGADCLCSCGTIVSWAHRGEECNQCWDARIGVAS